MAGYTRQSVADIVDGEDITAAPLNNEFNAIQAAMHATTGHAHDASAGNGPKLVLTAGAAVTGILPLANGGTGVALVDPNADRGMFWDDSAGAITFYTLPTGLAFSGTAIVLANDLAALEGLGSTGIAVRTASDTWVQRSVTGTANEITATNGDGVSGNIALSLPTSLTFTGKTVTGGQFNISGTGQSTANIRHRTPGNQFEFGHSNTAGYGSTIGTDVGLGNPFLAFSGEAGTNNNTYLTRGIRASIFKGDLAGGFLFQNVATASADNQSPTTQVTFSNTGLITTTGGFSGPHNGTVGATTPAAGTFTTLTSTSTASFVDTITLTSTDAGAAPGPILQLFRSSASPAASDLIGLLGYYGKDSGGNDTLYSFISGEIADPTNGSEDATLHFQTMVAGTSTERLTLNAAGATVSGTLTASGGGSLTGTWSNLGTVTTMDLNGGTIDGTTIGGSSRADGSFSKVMVDGTSFYMDVESSNPVLAFNGSTSTALVYNTGSGVYSFNLAGQTVLSLSSSEINTNAIPFAAPSVVSTAGIVATQAQQETATANTAFVTPGRQHYHPSAAKAWVRFNASSGTPTLGSSYNITSLTDGGVGITTVNIANDMSSAANNIPIVSAGNSGTRQNADLGDTSSIAAGTFYIITATDAGTLTDCSVVTGVVFGDTNV